VREYKKIHVLVKKQYANFEGIYSFPNFFNIPLNSLVNVCYTTTFFHCEKCSLRWKNDGLNFRPQFGHDFEIVVYSAVDVAQSPQFFQKVWS